MGTSPTLAPLLLPGCVARARQQCPSVTLKVVEGFSPQLLDALLTGRLDLAVMTNPPRTTALALTPLCSEPLMVLSPPGARGTRHAFSLAELCATPFIITVGLRTLVEQQLAAFGVALRVEAEVDSVEAIRRLGSLRQPQLDSKAWSAQRSRGVTVRLGATPRRSVVDVTCDRDTLARCALGV